jgi:putative chitinase
MLMITDAELKQLCPSIRSDRAVLYAEALGGILADATLNTRLRLIHFMAQIAHESADFRALVESTNYKDAKRLDQMFSNVKGIDHARDLIARGPVAIGNCIYANRLGNGNEASGDGYRYRGRGFIMTTGRTNYADVEAYSGLPLIAHPELLGQSTFAAQAAAFFWATNAINTPADADDLRGVTRKVNGPALAGLADRQKYLDRARAIWPEGPPDVSQPMATVVSEPTPSAPLPSEPATSSSPNP